MLTACQRAGGPATAQEIALGASVEQARGHLAAAEGNARAGRWDLAAVHAGHPADVMQSISSALTKQDPKADAELRQRVAEVVQAAQAKDAERLGKVVADSDGRLARVASRVMGEERAAELSYRSSVLATLAGTVADEYAEAFEAGNPANAAEYQDAYSFLQRALAIWGEVGPAIAASHSEEHAKVAAALAELKAALPALDPPTAPIAAERVSSLANAVHEELREAAGARTGVAAAGANELKALTKELDAASGALSAGNAAAARDKYRAFRAGWGAIEDGIRARDRDAYRKIEDAMRAVDDALAAPSGPDPARGAAALAALDETIDEVLPAVAAGEGGSPTRGAAGFRLAQEHLDAAIAALDRDDASAAAAEAAAFRDAWIDIEGEVKARSSSAYSAIENDTAAALSKLDQRPADVAGARAAVESIRRELAPFAASPASYGAFDAAIILLREGLEALLVVAALLAFLVQSGNADKRGWIWIGGAAGIAASVAVAVLVNVAFAASAATGASPEILEGATGLFAAAMLVYVSYWMHSKANLASWQRYIREKSTSALARNSLLSLAVISFLAVFREGGETVLFYVGIAPAIALGDLVLGLAVGAAGLVALGVLMLIVGVRIPIRPFFLVASALIYYLAFKFVGAGIHALQVAGVVPATPSSFLPGIDMIGLYPTWETTAVQVALLAAALGFIAFERARAMRPTESVPAH